MSSCLGKSFYSEIGSCISEMLTLTPVSFDLSTNYRAILNRGKYLAEKWVNQILNTGPHPMVFWNRGAKVRLGGFFSFLFGVSSKYNGLTEIVVFVVSC